MLVSNKNSVVNMKVQQAPAAFAEGSGEPKEIDGVIKGSGGLNTYLDLVPISDNDAVIKAIKDKFDKIIKELSKENLINLREHGASMITVDVTPIEWYL